MSTTPAPLLATALPRIEVAPVSSALVHDYRAGSAALAPFFAGHPADPDAFRRKAAEVAARLPAARRGRVAGALRPLSEHAAGQLERVLAGDGYVVTTGQQTGLFTGPLYTLYKALSAIRLAAVLEKLLGQPVLAVFWCAADDHDWAEVNHVAVIDAQQYVARVALPPEPDAPPLGMSHRPLGQGVELALDALRSALPVTPWRDQYLAALRAAYVPGRSMAAAFEEALAAVLAGQDIALVSSAHPLVKREGALVLERALREHAAQEAAVAAQTERLRAAGYPAQVAVAEGASNVFVQTAEGRDRLVREGDGWALRRTRRRFTDAELLAWLERDPAAFSPNVLLRPVVESALFPTLAYVGGPAETSYFAQIGCLFAAHGIRPPVVVPRHGVTLVEDRIARTLERFGLDAAAVRVPLRELVGRVLQEEIPAPVSAALAALRVRLDAAYEALAGAASAEVDASLRGPLEGMRHRARRQVDDAEKRILRQLERKHRTRLEQLRRAAANLYPEEAPQERVLNALPYLVRYGPGLLDAIREGMEVPLDRSFPEYAIRCDGSALAAPAERGIA